MPRQGFETRFMGPRLTPLAKWVMGGLFALYVLQILLESWAKVPVTPFLAFFPVGSDGFFPWQILTYPLVQGEPMNLLWQELALFFFLSPVEENFGRSGVAKLAIGTTLLGAL